MQLQALIDDSAHACAGKTEENCAHRRKLSDTKGGVNAGHYNNYNNFILYRSC